MVFANREEAARLLAQRLKKFKGKNPLVLAIPRGAVPMARIIADELHGEVGAVLVHKIPAPGNPELAIGSVGLSGNIQKLSSAAILGVTDDYIKTAAQEQLKLLKERFAKYGLKAPKYRGREVIIVDDGIATGATTKAAIYEVLSQNPAKLVVAAAVAPPENAQKIRSLVDELILLEEPDHFYAVGQFFAHFPQVTDDEAIKLLQKVEKNENRKPVHSRSVSG